MRQKFASISELRFIAGQKERLAEMRRDLSERERAISEPILRDRSLIGEIFGWFEEVAAGMGLPPCEGNPAQRKKFIFIILYLYSPLTLVGEKMGTGLRDEIVRATGCTASLISHNCEDAAFLYQHYRDHRKDVDAIYGEIARRLEERGAVTR